MFRPLGAIDPRARDLETLTASIRVRYDRGVWAFGGKPFSLCAVASMTDHRRHPRFELRRRVWCEGDHYTVWLRTLNASELGLQLRTSIPPPPGTRLRLSLDENGAGRVVADAEVVWARAGRGRGAMGLRILSFSEGRDVWSELVRASAAIGESIGE